MSEPTDPKSRTDQQSSDRSDRSQDNDGGGSASALRDDADRKSGSDRKDDGNQGDNARKDGDDKPKKESPLKKPWVKTALIVGGIVLVVLLIVYLIHEQTTGKYYQSTNDAIVDANVVTVSPQVNGYVTRIFVQDNQDVKAGQPLVQIDARDYEAQVAQYKGQVDVALANADGYRAQIREQQATVAQSHQQYLSALANARFQAGEAARYAPLAASGAETKEKAAQYRSQADSYAHTAASDKAQTVSARRKIASLQAQVRQALAQAESAKAQVDAAQVNQGLTMLRASVDGRVGNSTVRAGQYVAAGTKMMSVVPLKGIYVTANFKETQLGIMRPGQPATIKVDALPGVKLNGHVISASPGTGAQFSLIPPQNATGNFTKIVQRVPVRIAVDAGEEARKVLVPGMSATVEVNTIGAKNSMAKIKDEEKRRNEQYKDVQEQRTERIRQQNQ